MKQQDGRVVKAVALEPEVMCSNPQANSILFLLRIHFLLAQMNHICFFYTMRSSTNRMQIQIKCLLQLCRVAVRRSIV